MSSSVPCSTILPAYITDTSSAYSPTKARSCVIKSIEILFKGVDLKNAVGGPARITDLLGSTAQQGFSEGFKIGFISLANLMAVISISLFAV